MEATFVREEGYIIPKNGPTLQIKGKNRRVLYIEAEKLFEACNGKIYDSRILTMYYQFYVSCTPMIAYAPMRFITGGKEAILLYYYFNNKYHLAEIPASTPFGVIADGTGLFVITDKGTFEIKGDSAIATQKYPRSMFGTMLNDMEIYSICATKDIVLLNKGFIYCSKMYEQPDSHVERDTYAYARGHLYWIRVNMENDTVEIYRVENEAKMLTNTIHGKNVELAQGCKNFLLFVDNQAYLNGRERINADGLLLYFLPKSLCDLLGYR